MATVKARYIAWREGKPRFVPSPSLRALGYKGEDLRHGTSGPWFDAGETIAWAKAKAEEIEAALASGKKPKAPPVAKGERVKDLLDDFFRSPDFNRPREQGGYADKTRRDYLEKAQAIYWKPLDRIRFERAPELISLAPARALKPARVKQFFEQLERERGLSMALGVIKVLSAAYKWAKLAPGWELDANPCRELDLPKPERKDVCIFAQATPPLIVATADAIGKHAVADAFVLGLETGQRQNDRLAFEDGRTDEHGRLVFRQSKTGAVVRVKPTPELLARLAGARKRRAELELKLGRPPAKRPKQLIINEATGEPYSESSYQHDFRLVLDAVVHGVFFIAPDPLPAVMIGHNSKPREPQIVIPCKAFFRNRPLLEVRARAHMRTMKAEDWFLPPHPELAAELGAISDRFVRHTFITRAALSRSSAIQIASVSGHRPATVHEVIEHYLGARAEIADDVIDRLVQWKQREGMAG